MTQPIPYGFLALDPRHSVCDAPLWRDGSGAEPRLSGELLISLNALTPLLVGNHQHALDDKHSLLVPQMLDDGRVLIGASSLKGMLRQALASLLNAPMERVADHHYTYRPNLAGPGSAITVRAAVVLPEASPDKTEVALLDPTEVVFLPEKIWKGKALGSPAVGTELSRDCGGLKFSGEEDRDKKARFRKKLIRAEKRNGEQDPNAKVTLSHSVLHYVGGIDGEGLLARAHGTQSGVYRHVLYPIEKLRQAMRHPLQIPAKALQTYQQTQRILANDQIGHLSPGHPLAAKLDKEAVRTAIQTHAPLKPWQLIYVEYDNNQKQITSFGHHFHYRWAYTSSVCYKNRLLDGQGKLRPELKLHPDESADDQGAPRKLTGARLLFGYAIEGRNPAQDGLARGNFRRLAGRIAFNTAIEDIDGKTPAQRFMEEGKEIQLRILGMPRPSAVECYLKQTALPKRLTTYGDLPGDAGGDLAGRKFYRHQPDAQTQANCYAPTQEEKQRDTNTEERGPLVRYLSRPGSRFRCTLRFDSLRPWELGALLAALDPKLIEAHFADLALPASPEGYAHKLGFGKPLGLGSVRLTLDAARWQVNDDWQFQQARSGDEAWQAIVEQSLLALKEKLEAACGPQLGAHIERWLRAKRWETTGRADYPTASSREGETIYTFHTNLRRSHAAARRGNGRQDFTDLKKLLEAGA